MKDVSSIAGRLASVLSIVFFALFSRAEFCVQASMATYGSGLVHDASGIFGSGLPRNLILWVDAKANFKLGHCRAVLSLDEELKNPDMRAPWTLNDASQSPMLFLRVKHIERNFGTCLAGICPHCEQLAEFKLRELGAGLAVFGVPISRVSLTYDLVCSLCGHQQDFKEMQLAKAEQAKEIYRKLKAGELSAEDYLKQMEELNFPAFRALQKAAAKWACAVCGEDVPASINACWNCDSPRPGLPTADVSETAEPKLPEGIARSVHPWE